MTISQIKNSQKDTRDDWTLEQIEELFNLPFNDLIFKAQTIYRKYFDPNRIQVSSLLSIKTGGCPEDCKYCPQSAHYSTEVDAEKLMDAEDVIRQAQQAKNSGASRFCMGAAWRSPKDRDIPKIIEMVKGVKSLGLETCMTLGMLNQEQATQLSEAGLDYYNHNIDTSEEYYGEIISTRTFEDRIETLENVRKSGMKTCCGGILGMGESKVDRMKMLQTLANLPEQPQSVPINMLVQVKGTPLDNKEEIDIFDFIKTIAVARIMMPESYVRLSAGREEMSDQTQALCFLAGANSIFYGEKLLTQANPVENEDKNLFARLGLEIEGDKDIDERVCNKKLSSG